MQRNNQKSNLYLTVMRVMTPEFSKLADLPKY